MEKPPRLVLMERFHDVIVCEGYSEQAARKILADYFDRYMLDVPKFNAMLVSYELRQLQARQLKED